MRLRLLVIVLLLASPAFAQTVAIRAGHLIDPANGAVAADQVILIRDGEIAQIGAGIQIPQGADVVDLSSEWVMPGLMDAHTHLTFIDPPQGDPLEVLYLKESTAFRAMRGLHNAEVLLHAGFTTVREVGNDADYADGDVRRAIQRGWFDGPTILTAGKIITPFGGQSSGLNPELGTPWRYEYIDADTPEEMRKAVRQNIYHGADLIKLAADNDPYVLSLEEVKAAVDEAHRAGRAVAVHVYGGEAAQNCIDAGVDSIEHGFDLTDAQMQEMKQKGIFLVSTDFPLKHLEVTGTSGGIFPPPEVLSKRIVERLRRAYRIGVKIAFGTDTVLELPNETRADNMLDYLAVWRQAGIPAAYTLKAMTTNAAELLRINRERGAITTGLAADIIAMPSSPLEDTESLRGVNFVMKNGKVIRRP